MSVVLDLLRHFMGFFFFRLKVKMKLSSEQLQMEFFYSSEKKGLNDKPIAQQEITWKSRFLLSRLIIMTEKISKTCTLAHTDSHTREYCVSGHHRQHHRTGVINDSPEQGKRLPAPENAHILTNLPVPTR